MERKELETKATELEIEFDDKTSDDDLNKAITDKEKKIEEDEKNNDTEYLRGELKKVISQRDAAKGDKRKLQKKIDALESKVADLPDSDALDSLKKELKELKKFKEDAEEEARRKEEEAMDEHEKEKIRLKREIQTEKDKAEEQKSEFEKQFEKLNERLDGLASDNENLRTDNLGAKIIEAAAKNDAFNPSQIVSLVKDKFTYDNTLGKFVHHKRDEKGKIVDELSIPEYVKEFLSIEENENLVKSKIVTKGMETKETHDTKTDKFKKKPGDKYNPKDEDLIRRAELKGLSVEDYIDTQEMRDKKLGKIKE